MRIVKFWIVYLIRKWKIILAIGLLGGAIGLGFALTSKKRYFGELTFALEEKNSGMGSYASLASQFGLDLGSSGGGAFSGDNLVELLKSRLMIENALISPVIENGDTVLLINKYIEYNELRKVWEKKENQELATLQFKVGVPRSKYTRMQDSVLNQIHLAIKKSMLSVKRFDKKLNLVNVVCVSLNEEFSKYFAENLVNTATKYYIQSRTQRSKSNISLLEAKIDSIRGKLDERLYGAAAAQDQNLYVSNASGKVPVLKKQIDIQLLTTAYAELSKNLELSKYSLSREEPFIQIIDTPILPLKTEKLGKTIGVAIGGILGGIFASVFLLVMAQFKGVKYEE